MASTGRAGGWEGWNIAAGIAAFALYTVEAVLEMKCFIVARMFVGLRVVDRGQLRFCVIEDLESILKRGSYFRSLAVKNYFKTFLCALLFVSF